MTSPAHPPACLCDTCAPWPGPIDVTRLHSPAYRAERSRGLARWVRLPDDAVEEFVDALELSWRRQLAFDDPLFGLTPPRLGR